MIVVAIVVIPEDVVRSLVLYAELHSLWELEDLRHQDGKGEGVCVGAAVDVVQVLTLNILKRVP